METDYVYMVSFDGYMGVGGSENYLLGIYSTQELAEEAVDIFKKRIAEREDVYDNIEPRIKPIVVDHTYEFRVDPKSEEVETSVYLGGYVYP